MSFVKQLRHPKQYSVTFLKWALLGTFTGILGGVLGGAFAHVLSLVTTLRGNYPWLLFLLPFGGLATVGLYRLCKQQNNRGTNEVMEAVARKQGVNPLITPLIFLSTAMTHLFGGSAGREGAALQMGGAGASLLAKLFRLNEKDRKILILSGMSGVFAGLFGTPFTAALFTLEFLSVGSVFSLGLLPCYLSSFAAAKVSAMLGVHAETFAVDTVLPNTLTTYGKIFVFALAVSLVGIAMCYIFHQGEHLLKKWVKNPWLRISLGAVVIVGLTLLVGDQRYNGAGMDMALGAMEGHWNWYDFILKLLFTAITLAAGFKGGEIVPTFCIGATFGCVMGSLLGISPALAGALGLVALFCCVTNSPLTSIILSVELFGVSNFHLFALVCVIAFVLSGDSGLYQSQRRQFSKETLTENQSNE